MRGQNLANPTVIEMMNKSIYSQKSTVCIFLSHVNEDRTSVVKIGDYIQDAGFDIYLESMMRN